MYWFIIKNNKSNEIIIQINSYAIAVVSAVIVVFCICVSIGVLKWFIYHVITCSIVVVIINGGSLSTEYAVGALGGNVNAFFNRGKYTRLITRY